MILFKNFFGLNRKIIKSNFFTRLNFNYNFNNVINLDSLNLKLHKQFCLYNFRSNKSVKIFFNFM